jgi:amino acid transporter
MVVVGSMIGSGIFIVSADMARRSAARAAAARLARHRRLLTMIGALSYGELAAMMPKAGGQYVYLREAFSPLWGFPLRLDAVPRHPDRHDRGGRRRLRRYFGVLVPWIADDRTI